jgi:hypothetical protein
MICPACKQDTRRTRKGECIKCHVPLELFTYRNNGIAYKEFRLPEPEKAVEVVEAVESGRTVVDAEGRLLTPVGSNPEIILLEAKPRKRYKVIYRYDIPTNWVYCPDCHYQMFQNMVLNTGYLEQEFQCTYCKSRVVFVFITNAAIPHI